MGSGMPSLQMAVVQACVGYEVVATRGADVGDEMLVSFVVVCAHDACPNMDVSLPYARGTLDETFHVVMCHCDSMFLTEVVPECVPVVSSVWVSDEPLFDAAARYYSHSSVSTACECAGGTFAAVARYVMDSWQTVTYGSEWQCTAVVTCCTDVTPVSYYVQADQTAVVHGAGLVCAYAIGMGHDQYAPNQVGIVLWCAVGQTRPAGKASPKKGAELSSVVSDSTVFESAFRLSLSMSAGGYDLVLEDHKRTVVCALERCRFAWSAGCALIVESACAHCMSDAPRSLSPHEGSLSAGTEVSVRGVKFATMLSFGACEGTELSSLRNFTCRAELLVTSVADMFDFVLSFVPECCSVDVTADVAVLLCEEPDIMYVLRDTAADCTSLYAGEP